MYVFPYQTGEMNRKSLKMELLSLLGALACALFLMVIAYFVNSQKGLHKVAFVCIIVAVFIILVSLVMLLTHHRIDRTRATKSACDDPPRYKESWRRSFFSLRTAEDEESKIQDNSNSSCNFSLLPACSREHQTAPETCDMSPSSSSQHTDTCCITLVPPDSTLPPPHLSPPSSLPRHCNIACSTRHCFTESQASGENDPPTYYEAVRYMKTSSLKKLRQDIKEVHK